MRLLAPRWADRKTAAKVARDEDGWPVKDRDGLWAVMVDRPFSWERAPDGTGRFQT